MQTRRSQRDVARAAGLAPSYLSRLEHGTVIPSLAMLERLAVALGVSVETFLATPPAPLRGKRCPVSLSGTCIMALLTDHRGRDGEEGYTRQQLEVMRRCNLLVQRGSREALAALSTVVESLLAGVAA